MVNKSLISPCALGGLGGVDQPQKATVFLVKGECQESTPPKPTTTGLAHVHIYIQGNMTKLLKKKVW